MSAVESARPPVADFTLELTKGQEGKIGIEYKLSRRDNQLVVKKVKDGGLAEKWNSQQNGGPQICEQDIIIQVNADTHPPVMLERMKSENTLKITIRKNGPAEMVSSSAAAGSSSQGASGSQMPGQGKRASIVHGFFDKDAQNNLIQELENKGPESEHLASLTTKELVGNEPISPIDCVLMLILTAIPTVLVVYFFSDVGQGIESYSALQPYNTQGSALIALGFLFLALFYICDWSSWNQCVKGISGFIVVYLLLVGGVLKVKQYPQIPAIVGLFHTPLLIGVLRYARCQNTYKNHFYWAVTVSCFLVSIATMIVWLVWMQSTDSNWDAETKDRLVRESQELYEGENIDFRRDCWKDSPERAKQDPDVRVANAKLCAKVKTTWYLCWFMPATCSGVLFVIGLFCAFRAKHLEKKDTSKVENAMKQCVIFMSMLFMAMWISASIAGASMRLSGTLIGFVGGGFIALFAWLYFELGKRNIAAAAASSKLVLQLIKVTTSDWARALFMISMIPMIPGFLFLNCLNQCVKRCRGITDHKGCFTESVSMHISQWGNWNWSSILVKMNIWCIVYFTLMVGVAKITYVFLSWLNESLASMEFHIVIIIFYLIGYSMFLLPPVPGVPVYLTGGIIIAAHAELPQNSHIGFVGGIVISVAVGYSLKLSAVAGQWSIGRLLGKSIAIQKAVGVDKVQIRAIEDILKRPGMSIPKVAILVGGPDWPTSVLCGILGLECVKCVVGTMPCLLIAAPCCLAGAFLYKAGDGGPDESMWGAISGTTLAVASLGQAAGMLIAVYFMTDVINEKSDQLSQPRPEHKPIEDMAKAEALYVATYAKVTEWNSVPWCWKKVLQAAASLNWFSQFILFFMDKACFRSFSLQSKIGDTEEDNGLDGNVMNLVKPPGQLACVIWLVACLLLKCYFSWATGATKKAYKQATAQQSSGDTGVT